MLWPKHLQPQHPDDPSKDAFFQSMTQKSQRRTLRANLRMLLVTIENRKFYFSHNLNQKAARILQHAKPHHMTLCQDVFGYCTLSVQSSVPTRTHRLLFFEDQFLIRSKKNSVGSVDDNRQAFEGIASYSNLNRSSQQKPLQLQLRQNKSVLSHQTSVPSHIK